MSMELDIGIDIEEISRFKLKREDNFIRDVFSEEEINYCYQKSKPEIHLAGIFCAKEAVRKTLNIKNYDIKNITVTHDDTGKPLIRLKSEELNEKYTFVISISHTNHYATSNALRIKNE
ncbi:holo-[acyl-carrier-protein] synthase [archaeon D22]|nr:holo-[acyl-carrier-protein] synthase [archaeon D22]